MNSHLNGSILDEAKSAVSDRQQYYGPPNENHERTAKMWSAYLSTNGHQVDLVGRDVCNMNMLQKISRDAHWPSHDNLVDIAGYAENAYLCEKVFGSDSEDDGA